MAQVLLPKQRLKEYCRRKRLHQPLYVLTEEEKIKLHKYYTVQVTINGLVTAEGRGLSRRNAEFKAALNALNVIGQSDPSILESNSYRPSIGRSLSLDPIGRSNRSDSIPSMISMSVSQFSAAPSNEAIYPECDDASKITDSVDGFRDEEALSDSLDEGVYVESSESSSSPRLSSPASPITSRSGSADRIKVSKVANQLETATLTQEIQAPEKKSRFLSTFFLLSSLRAISRRSRSRKSNRSTNHSHSTKPEVGDQFYEDSGQSRPTSSSSSASSTSSTASASSAYSYSSNSSASSTSGSFTLEESPVEDISPVNGYTHLITQSIIEEEEEEEPPQPESEAQIKSCSVENLLASKCESSHSGCLTRSLSSYLFSNHNNDHNSNHCSHNHFSIFGPKLCSSLSTGSRVFSLENAPSASLLRYCVRMYLPLPYYDIRFDQKFFVTCRILISSTKADPTSLPVGLPVEFRDHEFTARGNGDSLHSARNMAASLIIEQLKKSNIYCE